MMVCRNKSTTMHWTFCHDGVATRNLQQCIGRFAMMVLPQEFYTNMLGMFTMMVLPQEFYNNALDMFTMMMLPHKNLQQCVGHVYHDDVATKKSTPMCWACLP